MKIETKFDVNNLLVHKFTPLDNDKINALEVLEIRTNTCYAGTQNFYDCRAVVLKKHYNRYKTDEFTWDVLHSAIHSDRNMGMITYREDELIELPQEFIEIILNKGKI